MTVREVGAFVCLTLALLATAKAAGARGYRLIEWGALLLLIVMVLVVGGWK